MSDDTVNSLISTLNGIIQSRLDNTNWNAVTNKNASKKIIEGKIQEGNKKYIEGGSTAGASGSPSVSELVELLKKLEQHLQEEYNIIRNIDQVDKSNLKSFQDNYNNLVAIVFELIEAQKLKDEAKINELANPFGAIVSNFNKTIKNSRNNFNELSKGIRFCGRLIRSDYPNLDKYIADLEKYPSSFRLKELIDDLQKLKNSYSQIIAALSGEYEYFNNIIANEKDIETDINEMMTLVKTIILQGKNKKEIGPTYSSLEGVIKKFEAKNNSLTTLLNKLNEDNATLFTMMKEISNQLNETHVFTKRYIQQYSSS